VDLETIQWAPSSTVDESEGAELAQLASFAVTHNPSLRAARNQIGVAEALLVEAGLLEDPEIGWDGMDALASQIVNGTTSTIDFVAGLSLSIALPRPGELGAKKGAARWRVEEARRKVVQVEWVLAREVYVACEDVLEAQRLLEQNQELVRLADSTREYFERAKEAGAATAIQANLALGDLLAIRAQSVRLGARLRASRHRLNALLGLPPSTTIPVAQSSASEGAPTNDASATPEALVERSVSLRPDLATLLASYQAAEEEVRLEVKRQFPAVAIGTGIWLQPGFFTHFNRPAIRTAMARRETLRGEVEAQVHEVRREIHDAYATLEEVRRESSFLESELLPNAEESLRLAGEAFDVGEVTLLEILTLQRALVDARTRTTEARANLRRANWRLLAATGSLLPAGGTETRDDEEGTPEGSQDR
jgi:cobalt-zinc-cadmium efflux system outer membrane protein